MSKGHERRDRYQPRSGDYRIDGEPRALYYAEYRSTYQTMLQRGILRAYTYLDEDIPLVFIVNNVLKPEYFDIRAGDRMTAGELVYPAKSSNIFFSWDLDVTCGAIFDRLARPCKDYLYVANVGQLRSFGFESICGPTPSNPLHVYLVHDVHFRNPQALNIPHSARAGLATLLNSQKTWGGNVWITLSYMHRVCPRKRKLRYHRNRSKRKIIGCLHLFELSSMLSLQVFPVGVMGVWDFL